MTTTQTITQTTYTVLRKDGDVIERGLTAQEAMAVILGYDGYRWAISLKDGETDYWQLLTSTASENSVLGARDMRPTAIGVFADSDAEAAAEIALQVIDACGDWRGSPSCMSDAEYDKIMADIDADESVGD